MGIIRKRKSTGFRVEKMNTLHLRSGCFIALVAGFVTWNSPQGSQEISFNKDIRPILADKCFACHGPDPGSRKARLRLDQRSSALADRGGYAAIVPGNPDESEMIYRIEAEPEDRMPPADWHKKLSDREKQLLRRWISEGAEWEAHWAYLPVHRPQLPRKTSESVRQHPIDTFVQAKLRSEGFEPTRRADAITLIRRLHFDLTGLPPTPQTVSHYSDELSPSSYKELINQLLASPHFGERMAMNWLDWVRYADSCGYHGDQEQSIWPYRDYVIAAFNSNKPFDEFTREQIAGDLLPHKTQEALIASGYNRLNLTTEEGGAQPKEYLAKYAADRVRNVSSVWLGATIGCAECHDHKFDPFSTKEFYQLKAVFADLEERGVYEGLRYRRPPEMSLPTAEQKQELEALEAALFEWKELGDLEDELKQQFQRLRKEYKSLQDRIPRTMISRSVEPAVVRILPRGDWMDDSGEVVQPAVPVSLVADERQPSVDSRLDFADWLVGRNNPLTARVFVNRLWRHFFGRGLSAVLDDLGSQGSWPTHPELLDWLAAEFMDSGWDVKHMVQLIVTSETYQQTSRSSPELSKRDPENKWLARQSRWRLEAELIRDLALAVSGLLHRAVGGPSGKPYQPAGYYAHLNFPPRKYRADRGPQQYRRGLYSHWQRTFLHPMLLAFDAPTREECTAERPRSNTPAAALALLNDPSFMEAYRVFAERVLINGGLTDEQRLSWSFKYVLSRQPSRDEQKILLDLLNEQRLEFAMDVKAAEALLEIGDSPYSTSFRPQEIASWTAVCRVLLNLNEAMTRN